jgi:hypothetical protein
MDDTKLWCVNVWGPDDVYAMPDRAAALERANSMNIEFGSIPRHEHDPIMLAVVIEWPHTPDSHAENLASYAVPCGRPAKRLCDGGPECWCLHGEPPPHSNPQVEGE